MYSGLWLAGLDCLASVLFDDRTLISVYFTYGKKMATRILLNYLIFLVGGTGIEPVTPAV
jgi:hypothetical protein